MQTPLLALQQATADAPQVPTPPPAPSLPGVPQTMADVLNLRAQRSELSDQVTSAMRRRSNLAKELETASAAERPGLEARIKQLDDRILGIEQEIARTGQLIALAPGEFLASSEQAPNFGPFNNMRPDVTAIAIVFTIFVLTPLAIAMARLLWKRATHQAPAIDREANERLKRLESAVDTIAVEVERISEGQRFVTRLMADREQQRIEAPRG
ncbi:MAG: hypothetical protein WD771_02865 [Gemmatimonadaceae bacterium]